MPTYGILLYVRFLDSTCRLDTVRDGLESQYAVEVAL
jgi:hypothetical protein